MRPYDLAKSIFLSALELPASERAAFVDAECAGDAALHRNVSSLLAHHDETLAGLEAHLVEPAPAAIGPWTIERELGRGGMGIVYLGRRAGGAVAAIKALRRDLLSPALLARFRREATVLARLDHPGIARLVETGVEETAGGSRPWLAMEYVEGVDLRTWASTPRPIGERLELMAAVADAVQHAHANGVVHRDLKPENVLVRADGRPVVLDFGVARLAEADLRVTSVLTQVGLLVGTIRYMSPEQAEARADAIGPASDVYTLGVLTYELLTGRLPYEMPQDSVHRALVAVMTSPPTPMSELPAPNRAGIERVLRAALAKTPAQRIASAGALADDLRRVAAGRRPLATPVRDRAVRVPWRLVLALACGATLFGFSLSTWRTPPTPADWTEGLLQPRLMYRRTMACIDSASVRLHYTTRTLAREREALAWTERARALVRTIGWRPYGPVVERLALFRQGEAEYLIAERTNDVARYEAASRLWYLCREPRLPRRAVALPDSTSLSACYLNPATPGNPLLSASMALTDAARLARPAELARRALVLARDGERAYEAIATTSDTTAPEVATSVRDMRDYVHARLGVALVTLGYHGASPDTIRDGLAELRASLRPAGPADDAAAAASHLHELGAGELRLASLARDAALLDSAFAHLQAAYDVRASLEGYTSVYLTRLELAQAQRLAARFDSTPIARARRLDAAEHLLAITPSEHALLGRTDATLYAIAQAAVEIDRASLARDTSALAAIDARLVRAQRGFDPSRTPLPLVESSFQRIRIAGLRWAVTHDARDRNQLRELRDMCRVMLVHVGSARWNERLGEVDLWLPTPRPATGLDAPSAQPY